MIVESIIGVRDVSMLPTLCNTWWLKVMRRRGRKIR
jgi:hypothetical protein